MNDLTLEVGEVHHIKVHQPQSSHTCGCKIECQRRPQTSRTDTEDARSLELLLTFHAYLRHDQVAGVAQDFVLVQGGKLFGSQCGRHGGILLKFRYLITSSP